MNSVGYLLLVFLSLKFVLKICAIVSCKQIKFGKGRHLYAVGVENSKRRVTNKNPFTHWFQRISIHYCWWALLRNFRHNHVRLQYRLLLVLDWSGSCPFYCSVSNGKKEEEDSKAVVLVSLWSFFC